MEPITIVAAIVTFLTAVWGFLKIKGKNAIDNVSDEEAEQIGDMIFDALDDGNFSRTEVKAIIYEILIAVKD